MPCAELTLLSLFVQMPSTPLAKLSWNGLLVHCIDTDQPGTWIQLDYLIPTLSGDASGKGGMQKGFLPPAALDLLKLLHNRPLPQTCKD
ncbi:hypothetical protein C8F04DRAFT_1126667 [Mycena alexandri]|uniref:Uncharacterized protein n=1 Tax=Mycena alexandri TaxID=1745969 RepID=A0AAD6SIC6_9AGAR|nr:hypothetical protein C8F04DRAFT_1126667 [Mycena alexandri]